MSTHLHSFVINWNIFTGHVGIFVHHAGMGFPTNKMSNQTTAVPDFGSGSGQKPASYTNQGQIQLWSECSRILGFGGICKYCNVQLVSKNCAVNVSIFSIRLFTLLRSRHHRLTRSRVMNINEFKQFREQITNLTPAPTPVKFTKSESGTALNPKK